MRVYVANVSCPVHCQPTMLETTDKTTETTTTETSEATDAVDYKSFVCFGCQRYRMFIPKWHRTTAPKIKDMCYLCHQDLSPSEMELSNCQGYAAPNLCNRCSHCEECLPEWLFYKRKMAEMDTEERVAQMWARQIRPLVCSYMMFLKKEKEALESEKEQLASIVVGEVGEAKRLKSIRLKTPPKTITALEKQLASDIILGIVNILEICTVPYHEVFGALSSMYVVDDKTEFAELLNVTCALVTNSVGFSSREGKHEYKSGTSVTTLISQRPFLQTFCSTSL